MTGSKNSHYKNLLHNPLTILFSVVALYYLVTMMALGLASTFNISLQGASNSDMFWFSSIRLTVFFSLLSLVLIILKKSWPIYGFTKPKRGWLLKIGLAYLAYLVGAFALLGLAEVFVSNFDIEQVQEVGFSQQSDFWQNILIGLSLVVMTPLLEETLFRGIFFRGLRRSMPFWLSSLVVSLVFAAAHGQWNVALDTFALSLVACWLVEKTHSIWSAILLHVIKNAIAFSFLFLS